MAESDTTQYHAEIINGANRCIAALREMEAIEAASGLTFEEVWASESAATDVLIRASGANTAYLRGFVGALAGYINMCNSAGVPDLLAWKPDESMTKGELQAYRQEMLAAL